MTDCSPAQEQLPLDTVRYFGDYQLLEEIARGGMGVVYKARQVSLNRTVAVKMLLSGHFASKEFVQRFRAEAQAAANLQHPNIVAIHEVGEHNGQNYFSMDYVEGENLAGLIRKNPVPFSRAAQYVLTISQAIEYAHQKGVLHRDLKPSNVLIDIFDQPRVTDFGLARNMAADSELTATGQVLGSPNYMPPEQAGKGGEIAPPSDVYSLGAILYHLLTGRPPFVAETIQDTLFQVVNNEPVSPRLLNPRVPRDLETICLKCLEKDSRRRYATAEELAQELERFLQHEPIQARPIGPVERVWRWCKRKPALATVSISLVFVLGLGVSGVIWQWLRAEAQFKRAAANAARAMANGKLAKTEASRHQQVATFLRDMLQGVGPSVALGRNTTMLREILDKTTERVGKDLKDQPDVEAELRNTLGEVYQELGAYEQAETMFREAISIRQKLLGNEHPEVAISLNFLAIALSHQGKLAEAEKTQRDTLAMQRKLLGNEHPDTAKSLSNLGIVLHDQGKLAEAETAQREGLAIQRKLLGNEHAFVAISLSNLGIVLHDQGKLAEAETMQREALAMLIKLFGSEHPRVATSLNNLASVLWGQGKMAEAEPVYRRALAMTTKLNGNEHPDVATTLDNLANVLADQGKLAEAEPIYLQALATRRKVWGKQHPSVATSLNNLGTLFDAQGKFVEAETILRESLVMKRELFGDEHPRIALALNNLAKALRGQGKLTEAETISRQALAMDRKLLGEDHPDVAMDLNSLGLTLYQQGKLAEAETIARDALGLGRKLLESDHPNVAKYLENLSDVLRDQGQLGESEQFARECLAIREKTIPNDWVTSSARNLLGASLLGQKKYVEAERLLLSGYEGLTHRNEMNPGAIKPRRKESLQRLVQLYQLTGRSDQVAEWKNKLTELDKAEPEKKVPEPKP